MKFPVVSTVYKVALALLLLVGPTGTVVTLYQFSRLLKVAVLVATVLAASLAVWPETSGDLMAGRLDPAR